MVYTLIGKLGQSEDIFYKFDGEGNAVGKPLPSEAVVSVGDPTMVLKDSGQYNVSDKELDRASPVGTTAYSLGDEFEIASRTFAPIQFYRIVKKRS